MKENKFYSTLVVGAPQKFISIVSKRDTDPNHTTAYDKLSFVEDYLKNHLEDAKKEYSEVENNVKEAKKNTPRTPKEHRCNCQFCTHKTLKKEHTCNCKYCPISSIQKIEDNQESTEETAEETSEETKPAKSKAPAKAKAPAKPAKAKTPAKAAKAKAPAKGKGKAKTEEPAEEVVEDDN